MIYRKPTPTEPPPLWQGLARATDPATSKSAAARAATSGIIRGHEAHILRILKDHDGSTAKQIAALSGGDMDQVQVSRRLASMRSRRLVRYGAAGADGCSTVWLMGEPHA